MKVDYGTKFKGITLGKRVRFKDGVYSDLDLIALCFDKSDNTIGVFDAQKIKKEIDVGYGSEWFDDKNIHYCADYTFGFKRWARYDFVEEIEDEVVMF